MNFELQSLITKTTWFIDIHTGLNDREIAESTTNVRDGTRPIFDFKAKRISLKEVSDNYHHTFIEHIYTLSTVVQIDLDSLRGWDSWIVPTREQHNPYTTYVLLGVGGSVLSAHLSPSTDDNSRPYTTVTLVHRSMTGPRGKVVPSLSLGRSQHPHLRSTRGCGGHIDRLPWWFILDLCCQLKGSYTVAAEVKHKPNPDAGIGVRSRSDFYGFRPLRKRVVEFQWAEELYYLPEYQASPVTDVTATPNRSQWLPLR
ncbi:hypothetical protein FIBSPDRAFT_888188 [Athelia psychrophila]|uniref:Uncharacterized protein n=1 Tax=Athelia psychrophila TaxID=1759441 RepID=A0A166NU48_9AGAM|nr:hypothetical protein FIBSPDRAFT_888188 [Fibularhizoctonia sp. CBS 109695]